MRDIVSNDVRGAQEKHSSRLTDIDRGDMVSRMAQRFRPHDPFICSVCLGPCVSFQSDARDLRACRTCWIEAWYLAFPQDNANGLEPEDVPNHCGEAGGDDLATIGETLTTMAENAAHARDLEDQESLADDGASEAERAGVPAFSRGAP
jgi:hypothetical protein